MVAVLREEVDILSSLREIIKSHNILMGEELPGVNLVLNTVDNVVLLGVLVFGHLNLSQKPGTLSSMSFLQIILHASSMCGYCITVK